MFSVWREYQPWAPLVLDGWTSYIVKRRPGTLVTQDPDLKAVIARYPNAEPFSNFQLIFWSAEPSHRSNR